VRPVVRCEDWFFPQGSFTVNASPKDIPGRNDRTLNGIFMLDGDSLIASFGAVVRPKGFFTERGDGCFAMQFERYHDE
jgi:hypothetical protein